MIQLSEDQRVCVDAIIAWRDSRPSGPTQTLTLGGYAGSGKTSVISYLVDIWSCTAVAAFCGKAAHVLRSKGVEATTIHALIYDCSPGPNGQMRFTRKDYLDHVKLIIIDEASMIDHVLLQDLLAFNLPILFVGDHGQLEPIGTNPGLMTNPTLRLEKIHRQAENNPILRLATAFREGRPVPYWDDPEGRLSVRPREEFESLINPQTQMICGFNKSRHAINRICRRMLGFGNELVVPGDRLICLRNNYIWNIFNGQQVTVAEVETEGRHTLDVTIQTDDGRVLTIPTWKKQYGAELVGHMSDKETALMDYGYGITAHKSQGSEMDSVLVLDEISSKWDARRWRYTVTTRAKERLIYCK